MLDLTKSVMPSAVEVDGILFAVQTDFQYWIHFSQMLNDGKEHLPTDFDFMYKVRNHTPEDRLKGFKALMQFAFPKKTLPRPVGNIDTEVIAYDYELDAELIYAAFMQVYHIDLIDPKLHLHWYKFRALFDCLPNTKFTEVISYRYWTKQSGDPNKFYQEQRQAWTIEPKLTAQEKKALEAFDNKVKKKKKKNQ